MFTLLELKLILRDISSSWTFMAFLTLIFFDFFTGVGKGIYLKTMSSEYGIKGLIRTMNVILLVIIIGVFSHVTHQTYIHIFIIGFFIFEYVFSIIENLELMNIKLPEFLTDMIKHHQTNNTKKMQEYIISNIKKREKEQDKDV